MQLKWLLKELKPKIFRFESQGHAEPEDIFVSLLVEAVNREIEMEAAEGTANEAAASHVSRSVASSRPTSSSSPTLTTPTPYRATTRSNQLPDGWSMQVRTLNSLKLLEFNHKLEIGGFDQLNQSSVHFYDELN